jgi:DNA-binding NarL/FixJ family response regulator
MLPPKPIRVLVADSHEMSRLGLRIFVETFDDLELVGETQDGMEILRMCSQTQPDVVLMSVNFEAADGIEIIRTIREKFPQVNVVVLSSQYHTQDLELAMQAGASSFLLKGVPIAVMADAIRYAKSPA